MDLVGIKTNLMRLNVKFVNKLLIISNNKIFKNKNKHILYIVQNVCFKIIKIIKFVYLVNIHSLKKLNVQLRTKYVQSVLCQFKINKEQINILNNVNKVSK